jgi:hypothetical protein
MATGAETDRLEEARLLRADLRLALTQADELIKKAEAVLMRSRSQRQP